MPGGTWYSEGCRTLMRHVMLSAMIAEALKGNIHNLILKWRPSQGRLPRGGNYWDNVG